MATLGTTGNNSASTNLVTNDILIQSGVFTASSTGKLTSGSARMWIASAGSVNAKMVIYRARDFSNIDEILSISDELAITNTTEQEVTFTFSGANQIAITNGSIYTIAVHVNSSAKSTNISRGTTSNAAKSGTASYASGPPTGGNVGSSIAGPIDAYITYIEDEYKVIGDVSDSGGATAFSTNSKILSQATLSEDAVLVHMVARLRTGTASGDRHIKGVIYADSSGSAGALVATSSEVTVTASVSPRSYTVDFAGEQLSSGTYWVGLINDGDGSNSVNHFRGSTSSASQSNADTYSDGPSNPAGSLTAGTGPVNAYVVYTPDTGDTPNPAAFFAFF